MPNDTKKKSKIFRWGVRALVVLIILFVVVSVALYGLARSASSRWERLAGELRAKGQPLTYDEIEATRPKIMDESNGEIAIRDAAQILKSVMEPNNSDVLYLDGDCKTDFFDGIDRRCLLPTREYVNARRHALTKLSELTLYEEVRLNVSYKGAMLDTSTRIVNVASRHRTLGKLVNLDAIIKTIDGEPVSAIDAIVLQLRVSEPLYAEPENILYLVAIANDWLTVTAFEGLLHTHELSVDELERLQLEWNRHLNHQSLKPSLLGMRANFIRMADKDYIMAELRANLATVKVPPKNRWKLPNPVDWIPFKDDWFICENRVQGVTILTRLLDASDNITGLLTAARQEQATLSQFGLGKKLIQIILPSLTRGIELYARTAARFRCVLIAIAAERFRLANGRFPNATGELIPEYLSELPRDPFDGKPIRIAKFDSGIVVYSIGENTIDDGGQVVPLQGERLGRDYGVRLIEPKERGLHIVDDVELGDE